MINRSLTVYPDPIAVELPRLYVVSWLANANGEAVTAETVDQAIFIKTEMFDCDDAAWSKWSDLTDSAALYASCQNEHGESIV